MERLLALFINKPFKRQGNRLKREYLVSWKGRPPEENSWEAEETLWRYKDMLDKLKEENPAILQLFDLNSLIVFPKPTLLYHTCLISVIP